MASTDPLRVYVSDDNRLVIEIGCKTFAHACENDPRQVEDFTVTDEIEFTNEVVTILKSESDDGTTLVHLMLDEAARKAVDGGAFGCWWPELGEDIEDAE